MRCRASGDSPCDVPDADDTDLNLRLELLRARSNLDEVMGLVGDSPDPGAALGSLLADSEELARLKASRRYRVASVLADGVAQARTLATVARRPAGRLWRSVRSRVGIGRHRSLAGHAASTGENIEARVIQPEVHELPAPGAPPQRATELRIAAIFDPFSAASFAPECALQLLTPGDWIAQLRAHRPHLLLVESAWTGVDGEWAGQVEHAPALLRSLVASCRAAGIATVFWNKEDPLHFGAFLETARLFDHVLTTDADSVPRYRRLLGHDRVGVMPFGIQPSIHHPVGSGERHRSSVFAGAWYGRLPERCRDFTRCADALALAGELVIHDRHNGQGQEYQRFPARYREHLRPAVSFEDTGEVFRRHLIGLNLNTVKSSPTMFARRALELAACGASVYGNHSVALQGILGGATVISDDGGRLLTEAWNELRQPQAWPYRRRRMQALRKVMREHTWARRVHYLAKVAAGVDLEAASRIVVVARVENEDSLSRVGASFLRQVVPNTELVIDAPPELELPAYATRLTDARVAVDSWVAPFHEGDYYGSHYLSDLVDAAAWQTVDVVGKAAFHAWTGAGLVEHYPENEYRHVDSLALRRAMFRAQLVNEDVRAVLDQLESGVVSGRGVSIDAWEYVQGGAEAEESAQVSVRCLPNPRMEHVNEAVARLPAQPDPAESPDRAIDGPTLAQMFSDGALPQGVSSAVRPGRMELCSLLKSHESATIATRPLPLARLQQGGDRIRLTLQAPRLTAVRFFVEVLGAGGQVLQRARMHPSVPVEVAVDAASKWCRFGAEVAGPVVQEIDGIWIGDRPAHPLFVPGTGRLALVTNAYPRSGNLYRNAFVHRRVVEYRRRGVGVDVFVVRPGLPLTEYEFDGVLVRECDPGTLAATLVTSRHSAIAVHVLDRTLWDALGGVLGRQPITVWMHGAEVQSWHHRDFNFNSAAEREAARTASEERSAFWREVIAEDWPDVHYVLVSEHFAHQTWRDLGAQPRRDAWSVIHNPIDTSLFCYRPKAPAMARRILSIRPHASKIYANDLVAETIRILAGHEVFADLLFTLVGDGDLWEENFAGLQRYPNVRLVRGFCPQRDIARLHRDHGVFLVPTRGDTQGVSRDEAMASGLVPVTNAVGAVTEFVDENCAELCPAEDADALAIAILALAGDSARFAEKSRNASERVARQSSSARIIEQEIAALRLADADPVGCCAPAYPPDRIH